MIIYQDLGDEVLDCYKNTKTISRNICHIDRRNSIRVSDPTEECAPKNRCGEV
jgi:hypothetical protein